MAGDITDLHSKPQGYYEGERTDMLKYIPPGTRATLEFGCGCGGFSHLVKKRFGTEAWGVEIDPAAAEEASRKLDKVIQGDALASLAQIPDGYFDCAIFCDIIEHLVDPFRLLLAVKPKLTAAGVVIASIPNVRYYRTFVKFALHGDWQYEDQGILDKTHLRFFTRKSIIRTFEQLGYTLLILEGMHSTSSKTYRVLNAILFNALADMRHLQFAAVAKPKV
jgi:2-polyprenyl-3-methyl-5-hydroxy-6-metoxy-1,4-benzoquinol methylase